MARPFPALIDPSEVQWTAVRAQGPGGQNVNKVSSAVHLRFDIAASSLPEETKARVLALSDRRITQEGMIVLKAQRYRSQERNLQDALARLNALVQTAVLPSLPRRPTAPTYVARQRRLQGKRQRSETKLLRARVDA